jgi:hypothetical protein
MTMTNIITGPAILQKLREIANAEPDATRRCLYVVDGEPHCIAARALAEHIPVDVMAGWDDRLDSDGEPANNSVESLRRELPLDSAAISILSRAQLTQDRGEPWREALASAEELAARILPVEPIAT